MSIRINTKNAEQFGDIYSLESELSTAHDALINKTGLGSEFTGWVTLPSDYDRSEFSRIKAAAEKIKRDSEAFLVIGIGGSYLGARAAINFLRGTFYNHKKKNTPDIYFVGNNMSGDYLSDIIELVGNRDFSINVISKSGTTIEPSIAFRFFKEILEKKYGKEAAAKRIYATTDKSRGALKELADKESYECFTIPDDIGGRYSVLTAVGLLPIAVSGADISEVMRGAYDEMNSIISDRSLNNPAWIYAAIRNSLYRKGKKIELLTSFEPRLTFMGEWWKQLFGESEGKNSKGIFPAAAEFSADLHSLGQYIQDGDRTLFETILTFDKPERTCTIKESQDNSDGLNFLSDRDLFYINNQAIRGTALAHLDGGVPNIKIELFDTHEHTLGALVYFFEFACGLSAYLLGVNPFDQPGVEAYKQNMFALLDKPGYSEAREHLLSRL